MKDKKQRVEILASMITEMLTIGSLMLEYKDLLEEIKEQNSHSRTMATSGGVLLEAMGMDSSEAQNKVELESKRTDAVIHLLEVLEETETSRQEFLKEKENQKSFRKQFGHLGY